MDEFRQTLSVPSPEAWPSLPYAAWQETCTTLHLWTQIVGKIRLAREPMINHWWQTTLYVTARGLTTSPIPDGPRSFEILFNFIDHHLRIETSDGDSRHIALASKPVAEFYTEVMQSLRELGVDLQIRPVPVEIADPIPFDRDTVHNAYDPVYANRFWRILVECDRALTAFRGRFVGKASPVQFFWGSFDLAASRFSGRRAPPHPSVPFTPDNVTREAYSHEVSSAGFWPGGPAFPEPIFYAYAYPEPRGFREARVPAPAYYADPLGEFVLPYEAVRTAPNAEALVLEFFQSTYEATATRGDWDRAALERQVRPR